MRLWFVKLVTAIMSCAAAMPATAAGDVAMLPVAFERSDPMWLSARNTIAASVACVAAKQADCAPKAAAQLLDGLADKLEAVNRWVNSRSYVPDAANWKTYDYWATIGEFLKNGGDCEDYAIAKYSLLRALGIPAEQMRLLIVDDRRKRELHAVLAVDTATGTLVLDNQNGEILPASEVRHYLPRVAINEKRLWRMEDMPLVSATASKR
jgi:predicted transglutaminase-like cysteine proteinase